MFVSEPIRCVVYLSPALYRALEQAAKDAGEPLQVALRNRLASSLPVSQTAARSGCAGKGEAPAVVSPALD